MTPNRNGRSRARLLAAAAVTLTACAPRDEAKSTEMRATSATTQTGIVGRVARSNPSVLVVDRTGRPVRRIKIIFAGSGNADTVLSPDGTASTRWTLGPVAGNQSLTATMSGSSSPSVKFTALAAADTAAILYALTSTLQLGAASSPAPIAPSVALADIFYNPKAGVEVTFEVSGAGGSVTPSQVFTDASGVATVERWTLGANPGDYFLTARVSNLRVSFTTRVNAGQSLDHTSQQP
jgi:hypothetical protein